MMIVEFLTYYRFIFLLLYRNNTTLVPSTPLAPTPPLIPISLECEPACTPPHVYSCVPPKQCAERHGNGPLFLHSGKSNVCCPIVENITNPTLPEIEDSTEYLLKKELTTSRPKDEHLLEYNYLKKLNYTSHRNAHLLPNENCGNGDYDPKLAQGDVAGLGSFPWMVLVGDIGQRAGDNITFFCGGTLINDYYVLTAAHCATHNQYKMDFVRLGEYDLREEVDCFNSPAGQSPNATKTCFPKYKDMPIREIILHEGWKNDSSFRDDIALIRLPQNASDKEHENSIRTICLPLDPSIINFLSFPRKYEVAGWGKTHWASERVSDVLMKSRQGIAALSLAECNNQVCDNAREKRYCPIDDNQICVKDSFQLDICQGDSGGPMMYLAKSPTRPLALWYQIGIVSFKSNDDCGRRSNVPSIFTNVVPYMPWILDKIRE